MCFGFLSQLMRGQLRLAQNVMSSLIRSRHLFSITPTAEIAIFNISKVKKVTPMTDNFMRNFINRRTPVLAILTPHHRHSINGWCMFNLVFINSQHRCQPIAIWINPCVSLRKVQRIRINQPHIIHRPSFHQILLSVPTSPSQCLFVVVCCTPSRIYLQIHL